LVYLLVLLFPNSYTLLGILFSLGLFSPTSTLWSTIHKIQSCFICDTL
jgi:hypothetical protein